MDAETVLTFRVLLFQGTNDIECQYSNTSLSSLNGGGASATIGVENADGTLAQLYSFNSFSTLDTNAISYTYFGEQGSLEYADLSVAVSAQESIMKGSNLKYTITVSNNGPGEASSVLLTDPLPTGTTFVSADYPGGWTLTTPNVGQTGTVTGSIDSFAGGQSHTFTVTVNVNAPAGTTLTNVASVTSNPPDVASNNNKGSVTTKVTKPRRTR
jgi:uncharacterized repeat protein (TIGR01451 family)